MPDSLMPVKTQNQQREGQAVCRNVLKIEENESLGQLTTATIWHSVKQRMLFFCYCGLKSYVRTTY